MTYSHYTTRISLFAILSFLFVHTALLSQKSLPVVHAPDDIIISGNFEFDMDKLTDPMDSTFGRFVLFDTSNRKDIVIYDIICQDRWFSHIKDFIEEPYDSSDRHKKYHIHYGKDGYLLVDDGYQDSVEVSIRINDGRECGQGGITRTFTVTFIGVRYQDKQQIWLTDCSQLYINPKNVHDTTDNIFWPNGGVDTLTINCEDRFLSKYNAPPELTHIELFGATHLKNISMQYTDWICPKDDYYEFLRVWNVNDWCTYDPDSIPIDENNIPYGFAHPHPGEWNFAQVFKVKDDVAPVLTCKKDTMDFAISSDGSVTIYPKDLLGTISDNCTMDTSFLIHDLYFDDDPQYTSLKVSCAVLSSSTHQFVRPIQLWVTDGLNNKAHASTVIRVTDPDGYCPTATKKVPSQKEDIRISPNPARDNWSITFEGSQRLKGEITLLDLTGAVVFRKPIDIEAGKRPVIHLKRGAHISNGMYLLKWKTPHSQLVRRVCFTD